MRRFLWVGSNEERKIPWVAWDIVTNSKKDGGLGVSNLQVVNEALLLKWDWRYKTEGNSLWKKIILGWNGTTRSWSVMPCSYSASNCWKNIVKTGERLLPNGSSLNSHFVCSVGDGANTTFWGDSWLRELPLRLIYPNLFILESEKWVSVRDRVTVVNGVKLLNWGWRSNPSSEAAVSELFQLLQDVFEFQWTGGADRWKWKPDNSGVFSVKSAKKLLYSPCNLSSNSPIKWKGWVPIKCKVMVWRAVRDRLPTRIELLKRGVPVQDDSCVFCHSDSESSMHLFSGCGFALEIWSRISSWCRLGPFFAFDVPDILKSMDSHPFPKIKKYILRGIVFTTLWMIWNERNNRIFNDKSRRPIEVLESIKSTLFFWIRHRARLKSIEWKMWCTYPLDLM